MFIQILEFSQNFVSHLYDFSKSILDYLSHEYVILGNTYSLFSLLFTSSIILVIGYGILKFVTDIVL